MKDLTENEHNNIIKIQQRCYQFVRIAFYLYWFDQNQTFFDILCSLYYKTCLYYKYCLKKIANDSIKRTVRSHAKKIVLFDLCTVYFIKE